MAHTIVASATREWVIGDDKPFTVIGERLNPTNRKTFIEELAAGNYERVERDALSQDRGRRAHARRQCRDPAAYGR